MKRPTSLDWYQTHQANESAGDRIADLVVKNMGSWRFIIIQTIVVALWITLNTIHGWGLMWDSYPFILLNLLFSTQAAYASPLILMAANRASERDKAQAKHQYQTSEKELKLNTELTQQLHELTTEIHKVVVKV